MISEQASCELRRLTPLTEPPAFSMLLHSILSSFNAAVIDCPDLRLLDPFQAAKRPGKRSEDPSFSSLHTFFSHTDPDHFDIKSGLEWRHPVSIHPISLVLSQYLLTYVGKNPNAETKPPEYKNVSPYETGVPYPVAGLGTVTPYEFSHGTFLHGFLIETKRGDTILIVPDSNLGSATLESIQKIKQRLGDKPLDIFIGDFKNFGSPPSISANEQVERLHDALTLARGRVFDERGHVIKLAQHQRPVFAYIKPGHIIQLQHWFEQGVLGEVATYLSPRLHELLGPAYLGKDPESVWMAIHNKTKPLPQDQISLLRGEAALYITDNRLDQTRYAETHFMFDCSRSSDPPHSTEREALIVTGGMSGHDPRAAFAIIEALKPQCIGISHNGSGTGLGSMDNLAKALKTNFPWIDELILPRKGSKHRF